MLEIWEHLTSGRYMPHGHCYLWLPEILWTHVTSDAITAAAYYSIPISILAFVRKRNDVDFKMVPLLFSAFIFLCGTTHVMGIFTVWNGYYGIQGMIKAATAIVSIFTAIWIWRLLPAALAIPSNSQMREMVSDATEELTEKNQQLAAANSEIRQFVSVASHDLKEPLRTLITYSQLLQKDASEELSDEAQRDLMHIMSGAKRMQALVNDILDLSRATRGDLTMQPLSIDGVIDDSLAALESRITSSSTRISRDPMPRLTGDPILLQQVYTNLITNAIKFARPDAPPEIRLTSETDAAGRVVLGVLDNGIGIDEEYRDKIFEPFERLHGRDHSEGTGIGLAICRRALERHKGKIWVEPAPEGGSHFRFYLGTASGGFRTNETATA